MAGTMQADMTTQRCSSAVGLRSPWSATAAASGTHGRRRRGCCSTRCCAGAQQTDLTRGQQRAKAAPSGLVFAQPGLLPANMDTPQIFCPKSDTPGCFPGNLTRTCLLFPPPRLGAVLHQRLLGACVCQSGWEGAGRRLHCLGKHVQHMGDGRAPSQTHQPVSLEEVMSGC